MIYGINRNSIRNDIKKLQLYKRKDEMHNHSYSNLHLIQSQKYLKRQARCKLHIELFKLKLFLAESSV